MTVHDPKTDPISELKAQTRLPFERARAMPKSVYISDAFLAAEIEHLFRHGWFCMGRAEALDEPGKTLGFDVAGQAVAVRREDSGALSASAGRCEEWLGWVYITLDPGAAPVAERLVPLADAIAHFGMADYRETFRETHLWDTNWKVLAENYMESYHLPICHAGTVGPYTGLGGVECPPGDPAFNIHWFPKEEGLALGNAHPSNTRLTGVQRKTSALVSIYPSHMLTLTPGYFWYLSLHPRGVGRVEMIFGGGFAPEFIADPELPAHEAALRKLLEEVNAEDRECTERVYRGLCSPAAAPGHLSHLERPLYDFAAYIAGSIP